MPSHSGDLEQAKVRASKAGLASEQFVYKQPVDESAAEEYLQATTPASSQVCHFLSDGNMALAFFATGFPSSSTPASTLLARCFLLLLCYKMCAPTTFPTPPKRACCSSVYTLSWRSCMVQHSCSVFPCTNAALPIVASPSVEFTSDNANCHCCLCNKHFL